MNNPQGFGRGFQDQKTGSHGDEYAEKEIDDLYDRPPSVVIVPPDFPCGEYQGESSHGQNRQFPQKTEKSVGAEE